jgi:fibronectin-binding autotransporter adhesin
VGGTLAVTSLGNGSSPSNIGQSTNAAANLVLNRGTLQYTGGNVTTDRLFTIGNGGAAIESSGSGALQFGSTGAIVSTDAVQFGAALSFTATPATTISVGAATSENTTANLAIGQTITGTGIAPGTTITDILNAHQIVISQATTGVAASGNYTFGALDRTFTLTGTNGGNNTVAGILANSATKTLGVTKSGSGKWILSGNNTYTGTTRINAGTLVLSTAGTNNIAGSVTINVQSGGNLDVTGVAGGFTLAGNQTLEGIGTVVGSLTVANTSTLSPGNSPGTLNTGNETWLDGGNYNWQIYDATGFAGTGYDTIAVTGTLDLTNLTGGTDFAINLWSLSGIGPDVNGNAINFNNALTQSWTLVSTTAGITGFLDSEFTINVAAANGTTGFTNALGGGSFSLSVSGNNLLLNYTAIPEPGTTAMLLAGAGTILFLRRRRVRG